MSVAAVGWQCVIRLEQRSCITRDAKVDRKATTGMNVFELRDIVPPTVDPCKLAGRRGRVSSPSSSTSSWLGGVGVNKELHYEGPQ